MEKINLYQLHECVTNIDYVFGSSYPICFKIDNMEYVCGIEYSEFYNTMKVLLNKCGFKACSEIFLDRKRSFNGKRIWYNNGKVNFQ